MFGAEYLFRLHQALNESTPSGTWVDKKTSFDYLYEALPKALPAHLMRSAKVPPIKKAKHGDSGGVRGAAALFLNCE